MTLLINNSEQQSLLGMGECISLLEDAIKEEGLGRAVNRNKSILHIPTDDPELWHNFVTIEGGIAKSRYVAIRLRSDMERSVVNASGTSVSEKYAIKLGTFCGLVLLYSSLNGELLAILNDGHVQHLRVGATYGLGGKYCSKKESEKLCILGSGGMALMQAQAYSLVRPIETIRVYSPTASHREAFVSMLKHRIEGINVEPYSDPRLAVNGADIVASCTTSLQPVIRTEWLEEGMHLSEVTQFEIDSSALEKIGRITHYRTGIPTHLTASSSFPKTPSGTMKDQDFAGKVDGSRIASLADVILGKSPGRTNEKEITLFFGEGTGVQFSAVSGRIYELAKKKGVGRELPSEWFLQDIRT